MLGIALGSSLLFGALIAAALAVYYRARSRRTAMQRSLGALAGIALLFLVSLGSDLAMQKLVSYLLMPVGLMWIALGLLTVELFGRGLRGPAYAALGLFGVYTIAGNPIVSMSLVLALESSIPEYSLATGEKFDAVLVLGGGVAYRADGEVQLTSEGDRIMFAARLWHAKKTPILVGSGSTIPGFDEVDDLAVAAETIWRELGIPAEAILKSSEPKNTKQELAAFKKLAAEQGWKKMGIVTSRLHLPRALRGARRIGLELTPIPADHRGARPIWHPALLIPQAGALKSNQTVCWELLGMLAGR